MKVVTTFHPSSSVLSSVKCRLASRDLEHLVIAKLNRIDVYSLREQGLRHECGVDVWGKVLCVKAIPISLTERSKLVLMITHPDPELVFFSYKEVDDGSGELIVTKSLSLFERSPRPAEFYNDLLVHSTGEIAVTSCYAGRLKVIKLKAGDYVADFDNSLPELNLLSLSFLPTPDGEYTIGILHTDYQERVQLLARDISLNEADSDVSQFPSTLLRPTPISQKDLPFPTEIVPRLIPVPTSENDELDEEDAFLGGVIILGGRKVLLYELASPESQAKQRGKFNRLEKTKGDTDPTKVIKAKAKEREREARKRKPNATVEWPWSEVTAWCAIDETPFRFLIGDSFGRLSMLSVDNVKDIGLVLVPLGVVSSPTTLTYLTNQIVYLGSHLGDSQLVQVLPTPSPSQGIVALSIPPDIKTISSTTLQSFGNSKGKNRAIDEDMDVDDGADVRSEGRIVTPGGSFIKVLESYKNIAPIISAVMVDTDGSGQRQLVTCSGGQNTGSLNVVRNGTEFQELAFVPGITNVAKIWSVKARFEDSVAAHVLVSTNKSTHLFLLDDRGAESTLVHADAGSMQDFVTNEPTIAFANIAKRMKKASGRSTYGNSSFVVQVVPSGAYLMENDEVLGHYARRAVWLAKDDAIREGQKHKPNEVVSASVNASQIVLALSGGKLVILNLDPTASAFLVATTKQDANSFEISAISCIPLNPSSPFSILIVVSYWRSNIVEIFALDQSKLVSITKSDPLPALVRSLLLFNFGSDSDSNGEDHHPYLICGLANGTVVHYSWKDKELKNRKIISLGHAPVHLTGCDAEGKRSVFASGNRATVLSFERKRLIQSPVMLKDITAACGLNSQSFRNSLVLAAPTGLLIGRVRELDKLHIRSIPFGLDNPRRITYAPKLKVFAVACTVMQPTRVSDVELTKSCLKIVDDTSFSVLSQFNCETNEEITALASFTRKTDRNATTYFCLGTYIYQAEEVEPSTGRLLLFTTFSSETRVYSLQLSLVNSTDVNGCVYAMKVVEDYLVVAVNSSVMLYGFESTPDDPSSLTLKKFSEWNHNYLVTSLGVYGNRVITGDQISSISLIKVADGKLSSEARDYGPLWPVSVEALNERHAIGANNDMNLFTFSLSQSVGRAVLERDGSYHIADFVSGFVRGSFTSDSTNASDLKAESIFFTSSGRIGVIIDVEEEQLSLHLTELQRNLAGFIPGVGGSSHMKFRAPKGSRGGSDADSAAFGFMDGDFLEAFLGIIGTAQDVDKVMAGQSAPERLSLSVDEFQKTLEVLQSLH